MYEVKLSVIHHHHSYIFYYQIFFKLALTRIQMHTTMESQNYNVCRIVDFSFTREQITAKKKQQQKGKRLWFHLAWISF